MKESQIRPFEHSEIKVHLLSEYLKQYMSVLGYAKGVNEVQLYDLFCGEGIYENGKEGSPIIILNLLKGIYLRAKLEGKQVVTFRCHFNDLDKSKIEKLKKCIAEKKFEQEEFCTIEYSSKNYLDIKEELFKKPKAKGQKTFIFIDPYGYKEINLPDIRNFLSDLNTELLLFSPTHFMYRFRDEATPDSLYNFLDEVLPKKEDSIELEDNGVDFIHKIRDGFGEKLQDKHFVDSFIITRDKNQFFAMFFFTSHIYGFEKFLQAKWNIDEEEGRGWSPGKESDLFSAIEPQPNIDGFGKLLESYLQEWRSNVELHRFTTINRHLTKHANALFDSWESNNRLLYKMTVQSKKRKGAFYISWSEVKDEKAKAYFKLR